MRLQGAGATGHFDAEVHLLVNVLVTDSRLFGTNAQQIKRFDRLEVFHTALRSYDTMLVNWKTVIVNAVLDKEFVHRQNETAALFEAIFRDAGQKSLRFWRAETREDWAALLRPLCNHGDEIVWLLTNDDHIFIDVKNELIKEGLAMLHEDTSRFKGLVYSHWPESLRLAAENGGERVGNFVRFSFTDSDSIVAWNCRWLWFLVSQLDWDGVTRPRLDEMVDSRQVRFVQTGMILHTLYVPLREQVRHLDGYSHAHGHFDDYFPKLTLNKSIDITLHARVIDDLNAMLTVQGPIPDDWITRAKQLYAEALM